LQQPDSLPSDTELKNVSIKILCYLIYHLGAEFVLFIPVIVCLEGEERRGEERRVEERRREERRVEERRGGERRGEERRGEERRGEERRGEERRGEERRGEEMDKRREDGIGEKKEGG
jgi:hypothetical protein